MFRISVVMSAIVLAVACGDDSSGSSASGGMGGAGGSAAAGGNAGSVAGRGGVSGADASSGGSAGLAGTAGLADAGNTDGQADADAKAGDAPDLPLPGLGVISGDCGPIDATEILSMAPFDFETHLDFGSSVFDYSSLSTGGKQVHDAGNLGGSSLYSEVFSFEVLYRCELATLVTTEGLIEYYDTGGKKTDLLVEIDGYRLGVSVTRAFAYPPGTPYSVTQAQSLLEGKLADILLSSQNVKPIHAWEKQILHVLAYDLQHRDALLQAYPQIPPATRADTIVMITVTDGADAFMY